MFYFNSSPKLNNNEVKQTLQELYELRRLEETGSQVYVASNALSLSSSKTTTQKVYNYMSTWYGWSTDLKCLPALTQEISKFIKSDSTHSVAEEEISGAIQGLGTLLNLQDRKSGSIIFIEQAIADLMDVAQEMETKKKERSIEQLSKQKGIQPEEKPSTGFISYAWNNYVPNLSFPSLINLASNQLSNAMTTWAWPNSKPIHPLYATALKSVQSFIYAREEVNSSGLQQTVRKLLVDKELMNKTKVKVPKSGSNSDEELQLVVPSQFYVDCNRFRNINLNNQVLFDLNHLQTPKEEVAATLAKALGQKAFERLGTVVHQSLVADQMVDWMINQWPQEWTQEGSPFARAYLTQAEGYRYKIDADDSVIKIDAKITLSLNIPADDCSIDQPSQEKFQRLGYVTINRQLTFLKKELEEKLENLKSEELVPHLSVKHAISDFCPTLEESQKCFNNAQ